MNQDLVLKSNKTAGVVLGLAGMAAGAWLAKVCAGVPDRNASAGFLLGLLILGLSLLSLLMGESRVVTVSPERRRVRLEIRRRWGTRLEETPFSEVERIGLTRQGSASNGSVYYDLTLVLKDGTERYLFGGCAFEGRINRAKIEGLRATIQNMIYGHP